MQQDMSTDYIEQNSILEVVPTNKMFVAKYGRPLMVAKVQQMARSFDPKALGTVYLSMRKDGQCAILDGQHRIALANLKGITELPARVFIDLSYEEEAGLYVKFATVNKQTNLDKFKARIEAHEYIAVDIQDILHNLGLSVSYAGQQNGTVQAVGVLEKLYTRGGRGHLRTVLTTIYRTWQDTPRAYTQPILDGLSAFLMRYEHITVADDGAKLDWGRLTTTLSKLTPDGLLAKAAQLKGVLAQTESSQVVGQVILYDYNHGLKKYRLPDWTRNRGSFK